MDVDEEWTSSPLSRAASDDETESDEMDIDVDLWLDEVKDVEMMAMTADGDNVQPFEAPWLTSVNKLWGSNKYGHFFNEAQDKI